MAMQATWEDAERFVERLSEECGDVSGVFAPARGGLCLGVMLSHALGVPLLMAPCDNCLIVDDICDTGDTMLHYRNATDCKIATMFYVEGASVTPDFWMFEKERGDWVTFPWEARSRHGSE